MQAQIDLLQAEIRVLRAELVAVREEVALLRRQAGGLPGEGESPRTSDSSFSIVSAGVEDKSEAQQF